MYQGASLLDLMCRPAKAVGQFSLTPFCLLMLGLSIVSSHPALIIDLSHFVFKFLLKNQF